MQLISFELTPLKNCGLFGDVLLDSVGQIIIDCVGGLENFLKILFFLAIHLLKLIFFVCSFLNEHLSSQLLQEFVSLAK